MGIWLELGIFLIVIAFGLWQIHDVKQARAATQRRKAQEQKAPDPARPPGDDAA